jgi:hypothetical protein
VFIPIFFKKSNCSSMKSAVHNNHSKKHYFLWIFE